MARFPTRRVPAPAAVLFTLLLTACGVSTGEPSANAEQPAATATEPSSPLSGSFTTITGGQIELSSLEGQDVVLWFWAPW